MFAGICGGTREYSLQNGVKMSSLKVLCGGLPLDPLPPTRARDPSLPHAPVRTPQLTPDEKKVRPAFNMFVY